MKLSDLVSCIRNGHQCIYFLMLQTIEYSHPIPSFTNLEGAVALLYNFDQSAVAHCVEKIESDGSL